MAGGNEYADILAKLIEKTEGPIDLHDCLIWTGSIKTVKGKYKYGRVKNPFQSITAAQSMGLHKAVYYLNANQNPDELATEDPTGSQYEISHLCHNSLCVNVKHLVRETHCVNQERIHCKKQGFCTKGHVPNCLF